MKLIGPYILSEANVENMIMSVIDKMPDSWSSLEGIPFVDISKEGTNGVKVYIGDVNKKISKNDITKFFTDSLKKKLGKVDLTVDQKKLPKVSDFTVHVSW